MADDVLAKITEAVTFSTMKNKAEQVMGDVSGIWRGGAQTFINKGTNGRWRDVLTEDDLQLYCAAVERNLSADCAHWLENGTVKPVNEAIIAKLPVS
ncbi:MAG: hypothetical protein KDE09_19595 [Anaerolineales bacterium]|nr:hypothetical protein [Anaerolineales bacterium]MCB0108325.1 hypothetical protein [Caldilineaceae bacterium]